MPAPRKTTTTTVEFPYNTTVADLLAALADAPPTARVAFHHFQGDQRDPSFTRLTITH